ncbi:hypothetical protein [Streptomyces broussonetiae]|uniref:DUF4439 domain-containing protein n=1 Tax=Streptomyces broussonetiae TaxID=2686304 RepID=A0ABV5EL13_9ACTN
MEETVSRPKALNIRTAIITLCVGGLVAGLGTWSYLGSRDGKDVCGELSRHERIRAALGSAHRSDMSCAELGSAIRQATIGNGSGNGDHSLAQAQAMKDVLVAVDDIAGEPGETIEDELAEPVSTALGGYSVDLYEILSPGGLEYTRHAIPSEKAWEDDTGVHMSVSVPALLRVMTALSADPDAYADLRTAVARQAAEQFPATPRDKTEKSLSPYPTVTSWVIGSMNAVAEAARERHADENTAQWDAGAFAGLSKASGNRPAFEDDPAGYITSSWRGTLPSSTPDDLLGLLQAQSIEMTQSWSEALDTNEQVQRSLLRDARNATASARRSTLKELSS